MKEKAKTALVLTIVLAATLGCSVKRYAVNKVGDALSQGGSTYESDDDIELVGDALPFSLKLIESLLAESPRHLGMLETACKGFATYSYVYVHYEADVVADEDLVRARKLRERSRRLYLRGSRYGLRGLETAYPGIANELQTDPVRAVSVVKEKHLSLLYWNAVALGLAIAVSKDDAAMLARLPEVDALVARGLELDESWNQGALHEFRIVLAAARPGAPEYEALAGHFDRARVLSGKTRAGLFVTYAEAVALPNQDATEFRGLLDASLAIDPDQREETRLANLVAQRRARWLLGRIEDLFLVVEASASAEEGGAP
jgi:predicted anti-sigma-YlaC factor YlaD